MESLLFLLYLRNVKHKQPLPGFEIRSPIPFFTIITATISVPHKIRTSYGFRRNGSTTSQILTIRRILEGVRAKNLQATLLFVDFTKAFDSIQRGKMEQILLEKETLAAIMILYRNTKVKVRSPDGDTEYFDIVAGVLQGDTLAPYLFIICLDYVLRTSIDKIRENGFELTKKRSRRYPAKTITDADYADDSDTGEYTQSGPNPTI